MALIQVAEPARHHAAKQRWRGGDHHLAFDGLLSGAGEMLQGER